MTITAYFTIEPETKIIAHNYVFAMRGQSKFSDGSTNEWSHQIGFSEDGRRDDDFYDFTVMVVDALASLKCNKSDT